MFSYSPNPLSRFIPGSQFNPFGFTSFNQALNLEKTSNPAGQNSAKTALQMPAASPGNTFTDGTSRSMGAPTSGNLPARTPSGLPNQIPGTYDEPSGMINISGVNADNLSSKPLLNQEVTRNTTQAPTLSDMIFQRDWNEKSALFNKSIAMLPKDDQQHLSELWIPANQTATRKNSETIAKTGLKNRNPVYWTLWLTWGRPLSAIHCGHWLKGLIMYERG